MMWTHIISMSTLMSAVLMNAESTSKNSFPIKMPNVTTSREDSYMCTSVTLTSTSYLVGFTPEADMHIAHHMLLFKCTGLVSNKKAFPCMQACYGSQFVYAWARQAPSLKLPSDVAFEVGPGTKYPHLVLQVHYLKRMTKPDASGVIVHTVNKPRPKIAGVMIMVSGEHDIPGRTKDFRTYFACTFKASTNIQPFAFRTHAHTLGRTIFAYHFPHKVAKDGKVIGRASPQWPQAFYNTSFKKLIRKRDAIVGACVYDSMERETTTSFGSTHKDEMCNFYMMYSRDRNSVALRPDEIGVCQGGVNMGDGLFDRLVKAIPEWIFSYLPKELKSVNLVTKDIEDEEDKDVDHEISSILKTIKKPSYNFELVTNNLVQFENLGQVSGVAVNSEGHLYVFHRGNRVFDGTTFDSRNVLKASYRSAPIASSTILVVNRETGKVIKKFGENMFYLPHGINIDSEDNIWVTDVGLHQVMKFKPDDLKTPEITLGVRFKPGSDTRHFCKPTDTVAFPSGSFYVSDGYCNSRILKFSKDGKYLATLKSSKGSFEVPHGLARISNSEFCVADRERDQIECFSKDSDTSKLTVGGRHTFGDAVYALSAGDNVGDIIHGVVRDSGRNPKGFTYSIKRRKVLSRWGAGLILPHDVQNYKGYNYVAEIGKPYRVSVYKREVASNEEVRKDISDTLSLHITPPSHNFTRYESKGFMDLLGANSTLLIGVVIILPLAIIVFGATIVHLHRNRMCCSCFYRKRGGRYLRTNRERGRFEPLLNDDDDESDSDENDDILNTATLKRRSDQNA